MDKYSDIFDILYEVKENISDNQYVKLNNLIKDLYEEAKLMKNNKYESESEGFSFDEENSYYMSDYFSDLE